MGPYLMLITPREGWLREAKISTDSWIIPVKADVEYAA
jgi:hypothetical protein